MDTALLLESAAAAQAGKDPSAESVGAFTCTVTPLNPDRAVAALIGVYQS